MSLNVNMTMNMHIRIDTHVHSTIDVTERIIIIRVVIFFIYLYSYEELCFAINLNKCASGTLAHIIHRIPLLIDTLTGPKKLSNLYKQAVLAIFFYRKTREKHIFSDLSVFTADTC